jgi:hypothetical protein
LIHERKASPEKASSEALADRLKKYTSAKKYSSYVASWVHERGPECQTQTLGWGHRANQQSGCGAFLHFRQALSGDDTAWKLHNAIFCQQGHTCPLCAMRKGARTVQAIVPRVLTILEEHPAWEAYFVTLTLANGPDLRATFGTLDAGLKALVRQCRQAKINPLKSRAMRAVAGGVGHIETKRGAGGQWHPHYHGLWLCDRSRMADPRRRHPIDTGHLIETWQEVTGGAGQWLKVLPLRAESLRRRGTASVEQFTEQLRNDVCEVVKYSVKFEDLLSSGVSDEQRDARCLDLWETADVLRGKTLLRSFGCLHGVKVPEDLRDEPLNWEELEYIERMFRFFSREYREVPVPGVVPARHSEFDDWNNASGVSQ